MKFPVVTLDVVLLAAAVAGFGAGAASALVYDRNRIISGELWRLITGNWVHFSKTHFAYDVLAFGIAGSWIELRGHRGFGLFCLLSAALVGLTVFLARPDLEIFGGLSGLATGATVLLCLHGVAMDLSPDLARPCRKNRARMHHRPATLRAKRYASAQSCARVSHCRSPDCRPRLVFHRKVDRHTPTLFFTLTVPTRLLKPITGKVFGYE